MLDVFKTLLLHTSRGGEGASAPARDVPSPIGWERVRERVQGEGLGEGRDVALVLTGMARVLKSRRWKIVNVPVKTIT
jgi:hypothetical protein